jgi:spore germination protein
MIPDDDKISSYQLGVFIFNIILGIGILNLPAALAKEVENDAWMLCILGGALTLLLVYFMCKVGEKYSDCGFVGTLRKMFGKFLGTILAIPVFIYFLIFTAIVIRTFGETTKLFLLSRTPLEFIIIPLIILTVFLVRSGVEPTARFFEAVTPFIIFTLLILMLVALPESDFSNIQPIMASSFAEYFSGVRGALFAFGGFEILIVLFPFLRKPRKAFKASSYAIIAITIVYTLVTVLCLARFGAKETEEHLYPVMALVKSAEIPGAFIERLEGLLISIWVIFVFTTVSAVTYGYSVIGGDLLGHRNRKHVISLFLPVIYIIGLMGENTPELAKMSDMLMIYLGTYSFAVLPILMFIVSLFKKRGGERNGT